MVDESRCNLLRPAVDFVDAAPRASLVTNDISTDPLEPIDQNLRLNVPQQIPCAQLPVCLELCLEHRHRILRSWPVQADGDLHVAEGALSAEIVEQAMVDRYPLQIADSLVNDSRLCSHLEGFLALVACYQSIVNLLRVLECILRKSTKRQEHLGWAFLAQNVENSLHVRGVPVFNRLKCDTARRAFNLDPRDHLAHASVVKDSLVRLAVGDQAPDHLLVTNYFLGLGTYLVTKSRQRLLKGSDDEESLKNGGDSLNLLGIKLMRPVYELPINRPSEVVKVLFVARATVIILVLPPGFKQVARAHQVIFGCNASILTVLKYAHKSGLPQVSNTLHTSFLSKVLRRRQQTQSVGGPRYAQLLLKNRMRLFESELGRLEDVGQASTSWFS